MSEPLMPSPRRDERGGPSAEDVDLEVAVDEQGGEDGGSTESTESASGEGGAPAGTGDTAFRTPRAGDSLSPEELRRES